MKFNQLSLFALLITGVLFVASCTPDEPQVKTGTVTLEFDHIFGGEAFSLNNEYTTANADVITPTIFRYYVSNISLSNEDGSTIYVEPNSYHIVDIAKDESLEIDIEDVPNGEYTKVNFTIGVDSAANVSGAQEGALDPANGLFWSWNMGYIFLKLEGSTQASTDFRYHIGGFRWNANNIRTREANVPTGSMINVNGASSKVHFMVDVAELFKNPNDINVEDTPEVVMPNPTSVMISENYQDMYMIDHVHNE